MGENVLHIALVGLWVSGSHDLGEIADVFMMLFANMLFAAIRYANMRPGDEAISESHKYMDLSLVNNSSVDFFSFTVNALFSTFPQS